MLDRVAASARRLLRNTDLAQGVTQEVFLQIWQHADRYDPDRGTALGWIHGVTRSRTIDRIRAAQAALARDQLWATGSQILRPPTHEVDDQLLADLKTARLQAALLSISPLQRQVIVLVFFGEHTHQQIAEALHCPLGTVKTRIRDGLRRLRTQLGEHQLAHPLTRSAAMPTGSPASVTGRAA